MGIEVVRTEQKKIIKLEARQTFQTQAFIIPYVPRRQELIGPTNQISIKVVAEIYL